MIGHKDKEVIVGEGEPVGRVSRGGEVRGGRINFFCWIGQIQ